MFSVAFDPNQIEEAEYGPIPEGIYTVRVEKCKEDVTQSSQKNRLNLQLRVLYDEKGDPKYKDRVLFQAIVDGTEHTERILKNIMQGTGVTQMPITVNSFTNRSGKVKVKHDEYKGEKREKISYWIKPEAGEANTPAQEAVNPGQAPGAAEDDIPF